MSFCGTPDMNRRFRMLGFAMHCSTLVSSLMNLKYNRMTVDENGQTRLFSLTTEEREDFAKIARNLRWLITEHQVHDANFWSGYSDFEYTDYEFREMFDPFQRDKTEAVVAILDRIGNGEKLDEEEMSQAMDFLRRLSGMAHANTSHGGCF